MLIYHGRVRKKITNKNKSKKFVGNFGADSYIQFTTTKWGESPQPVVCLVAR